MNSKKILFVIILLIGCLSQFASDIYAPSLPSIATLLKAPINLVQFSMAIYMLGVSLSLLVYGPVSEGIGRKVPVITGLVIFLIGSLLCLFAKNIDMLLIGRFIQGLGAGGGAGLWRAIFRDVYSGKELAKYASYLTILVMIIIPAAPAFGGYLDHLLSWRSIFAALSIYSVIAIMTVIFYFKETSRHHHFEKLKFSYIKKTFRLLLSNRVFMGISISVFFTYGATFAWFVTGPVLLIKVVGISSLTFGWLSFLGGGIAFSLGDG